MVLKVKKLYVLFGYIFFIRIIINEFIRLTDYNNYVYLQITIFETKCFTEWYDVCICKQFPLDLASDSQGIHNSITINNKNSKCRETLQTLSIIVNPEQIPTIIIKKGFKIILDKIDMKEDYINSQIWSYIFNNDYFIYSRHNKNKFYNSKGTIFFIINFEKEEFHNSYIFKYFKKFLSNMEYRIESFAQKFEQSFQSSSRKIIFPSLFKECIIIKNCLEDIILTFDIYSYGCYNLDCLFLIYSLNRKAIVKLRLGEYKSNLIYTNYLMENKKNKDPCKPNPCLNSGKCTTKTLNKKIEPFDCTCISGFQGRRCELVMGCLNCNGKCGKHKCKPCNIGWSGDFCEIKTCKHFNMCQNEGVCKINKNLNIRFCYCKSGYKGKYCEISLIVNINKAHSIVYISIGMILVLIFVLFYFYILVKFRKIINIDFSSNFQMIN